MKKIICIVLAMFIYANNAFAYGNVSYDDFNEYKSKYRILYGALLVIGGSLLAYDGFRTVKVDKSKPAVLMNFSAFWYTDAVKNQYVMISSGSITNTGNVDLKNINVWARYKTVSRDVDHEFKGYQPGEFGTQITFDGNTTTLPKLIIGDSTKWTYEFGYTVTLENQPEGNDAGSWDNPNTDHIYNGQYPSSTEPKLLEIKNVEYDYKKKYKNEMNNVYEGVIGVILIAGGAYLLIDYLVSLNRFDYYMKKNNMNFYVENTFDEVAFKFSKKL